MSRLNLDPLMPRSEGEDRSDRHYWATVTNDDPLEIKLDGDTAPLPLAPDTLVSGLKPSDRVLVALTANNDPTFRGRRVVVLGRSGGLQVVDVGPRLASLENAAIGFESDIDNLESAIEELESWRTGTVSPALSDLDGRLSVAEADIALIEGDVVALEAAVAAAQFPNAGYGRTAGFAVNHTSTSYATVPGISATINKRSASTRLRIEAGGSYYFSDAFSGGLFAVRVNGVDHTIHQQFPAVIEDLRLSFSGVVYVSGLPAGPYTVNLRVRLVNAIGSLQMDSNDFAYIDILEVT